VPVVAPASFARWPDTVPRRRRWIAAGTWVVAAVVFVGPGWGLLAAIAALALVVVLGRPRLAGVLAAGILALMALAVVWIVWRQHPYPNAGWPVRFERIHGLGLFAAVSLGVVTFAGSPGRPPADPPAASDTPTTAAG
jgi:arabinofuranan 3-O-arabinosyltransferase